LEFQEEDNENKRVGGVGGGRWKRKSETKEYDESQQEKGEQAISEVCDNSNNV
jgi:hypothetical protein